MKVHAQDTRFVVVIVAGFLLVTILVALSRPWTDAANARAAHEASAEAWRVCMLLTDGSKCGPLPTPEMPQ